MGLNILTLGKSKNYTDEEVAGGGAIKGKNCVIEKIEKKNKTNTVTFQWTLDNGTVKTGTMTVVDGADPKNIKSAKVDNDPDSATYNHLLVTLTDDSVQDWGVMPSEPIAISKVEGNALSKKDDGLYVAKGAVAVSKAEGNSITSKEDGLYAPQTPIVTAIGTTPVDTKVPSEKLLKTSLDAKVDKVKDKSLVADSDIAQITTNKNAIATLNGTGDGSVDKKISTEIGKLTYLTKEVATKAQIDEYVADPTKAKFNVIYLMKDTTATGDDKYFEYQRLGDATTSSFEMTGSTSTDLSGYFETKNIVTAFSATPSDTKVASEKLVKKSIDANANVQSDWNQTDSTKDDFIKNKPSIPSSYDLAMAELKCLGWVVPDSFPVKNTISGNKLIQRVFRLDFDYKWYSHSLISGLFTRYTTDVDSTQPMYSNRLKVKTNPYSTESGEFEYDSDDKQFEVRDTSLGQDKDAFMAKYCEDYILYVGTSTVTHDIKLVDESNLCDRGVSAIEMIQYKYSTTQMYSRGMLLLYDTGYQGLRLWGTDSTSYIPSFTIGKIAVMKSGTYYLQGGVIEDKNKCDNYDTYAEKVYWNLHDDAESDVNTVVARWNCKSGKRWLKVNLIAGHIYTLELRTIGGLEIPAGLTKPFLVYPHVLTEPIDYDLPIYLYNLEHELYVEKMPYQNISNRINKAFDINSRKIKNLQDIITQKVSQGVTFKDNDGNRIDADDTLFNYRIIIPKDDNYIEIMAESEDYTDIVSIGNGDDDDEFYLVLLASNTYYSATFTVLDWYGDPDHSYVSFWGDIGDDDESNWVEKEKVYFKDLTFGKRFSFRNPQVSYCASLRVTPYTIDDNLLFDTHGGVNCNDVCLAMY